MPRAVSLTDEVLAFYGNRVSELTLLPSGGGVYEVTLNGDLVYSKKETGRHAEEGEVLGLLKARTEA